MRRSAGRAPQTGSEVCGWALSLREEEQLPAGHWELYVQSQGRSPQLTRPLPACHTPSTVTPHPLPSHTPQPPCSTIYPAPACPTHHMYSKENPSHLLPSCAGVSLAQSHPWEALRPEANPFPLLESAARPSPHSPTAPPGWGPKGCLSVTLESMAATKEQSAVWLNGLRIAQCMAHPVVSTQRHRGPER